GFQLAAHGEIGLARKKILRVIDLAVFSRRIFDVDRGNAKQFARAFAIASGNDRRVDVKEAAVLKKFVNGECEPAPHTKDAAEKIRARPQMRDLAQKFRRVPFLLEGISFIRAADDVDLVRDQFPSLAFAVGSDERASDANGSAGG